MKNLPSQKWALFHVHRVTGERVRYPQHSFPGISREQAKAAALDSRIGTGRGSAHHGDWRTEAHPDVPDNARTNEALQTYCREHNVKDGDTYIYTEYKISLANGDVISVPNVPVEFYYIQQDDGTFRWEEAISCKVFSEMVETAIVAKYPDYYKRR